MPDVVVTGSSSGIGLAACHVLIRRGFRVFGSVRTQADADRVREQLGTRYVPLIFDVIHPDSVNQAAAAVKETIGEQRLFGLVNNAGIAVLGPLAYLPLERFRQQIEVNLLGVPPSRKPSYPCSELNRIALANRGESSTSAR